MRRLALWGAAAAVLLIGAGLYSYWSAADQGRTYRNPVFEPVLADPSVVRADDGFFYAFGTEDDWGDGHGPRLVPILRSKTMTEWEVVGDAFAEKPKWHEYGGLWAPDISLSHGRYYLYYAMSGWGDGNPGIGVATSPRPEGPFQDHGKLFFSSEIGVGNSIDPMRFTDDDGTSYLFWGSFRGIYAVRLSKDGLSTVGEPVQVAGTPFEAAYVIKRGGFYYFFGSKGSCCEGEKSGYHVAVGRAESALGPYKDKDGQSLILSDGTLLLTGHFESQNVSRPFAGTGHNAVIRDDEGTDWLVYHAVEKAKPLLPNGATRRPLMIDPIVWKDGWPTIENLVPSVEERKAPVFNRK